MMVRKRIHNIRIFFRDLYIRNLMLFIHYTCCFVFPQTGWHIRLSVFPAPYMHRDRRKQVVFLYFFFRSLIAYVFFAATYHLLSVDYIVPHPTDSVRRSRMTSTKLLHQLYDSVFKPFSFFFLYYSSNVWLYPPAQKTKQNNNQKKRNKCGCVVYPCSSTGICNSESSREI